MDLVFPFLEISDMMVMYQSVRRCFVKKELLDMDMNLQTTGTIVTMEIDKLSPTHQNVKQLEGILEYIKILMDIMTAVILKVAGGTISLVILILCSLIITEKQVDQKEIGGTLSASFL